MVCLMPQYFARLASHWPLVALLTRRRIAARYRGSLLGALWVVLLPAAMVTLFTLVFTRFLPVRWPGTAASAQDPLHAAVNIYLGLLLYNYAAENLSTAPHLILEHPQYVKKIAFPLELLAYVNALSPLIPLTAGLLIVLLLAAFDPAAHFTTLWALPLYWLPLLIWAVALQWSLGALTVFVRDLVQLIPPLSTALMFFSPVFYSTATLPEPWPKLLFLNPLTPAIEASRQLLYPLTPTSVLPPLTPTLLSLGAALLAAAAARHLFVRLKPGFADVL
jgi:lipopolysaccharide transport system permease protein